MYDIALRRGDFIKWEKCNHNLPDYVIWYKVTIDGIDFCIGELVSFDKAWKSPKAKGALVKYELGVSIYSGDIAGWIYEPHVGHKHNLNIPQGIATAFVQGWYGMVETDAGYKGEADLFRINMITRMIRKRRKSRNCGQDRKQSTGSLNNGEFHNKDSGTIRQIIIQYSILLLY